MKSRRFSRLFVLLITLAALPVASASALTTVSLTFDDGPANQYVARSLLASHGMHGTFYVNSNRVGSNSYYMTWSQIHDLAADGNEIGGHTLDQVDLTAVTAAEAQHQVCDDRAALQAQGFAVFSFAYPFSRSNPSVRSIVQGCGYTTGRRQGGLFDPVECNGCAYANAIPPADPFVVKTQEWMPRAYTLADLQGWVTQAESHGGGWVPVAIGDICNGCGNATITAVDLAAFLDWLQARQGSGTVVKTVGEIMPPADAVAPATTIACDGAPCASSAYSGSVSVTLAATDAGSGVAATRYTTDGSDPTASSAAYTAPIALSANTTVKFRSWDNAGNVEPPRTQTIQVAAPPPPPPPPPPSSPTTVSLTFDDGVASQYAARSLLSAHGMHGTFYVNSNKVGTGSYYMSWTQIGDLAADGNEIGGHTLDQVDLTAVTSDEATRQVCADRDNLATRGFSVSSFSYPFSRSNPSVRSIVQGCGYTTGRRQGGLFDPVECNGCGYANAIPPADPFVVKTQEWLPRPYTLADLQGWVTQAESHGGGWVPIAIGDICNGCGSATVSQADLSAFLDWLQARQAQGTVVKTVSAVVPPGDAAAPTTTIACDGAPCSASAYAGPVSATLAATDAGSGVATTRYTTDGSAPTAASTAYASPISIANTTTVKFRSWDNAGNVEPTRTQVVTIAAPPPPPPPTTVTLTFDDNAATQYQTRSMLSARGMHATFYINTNKVGANSYYMNWAQIHDLAADGNEIGGHSLDHLDLTQLTLDEVKHQVCDDRQGIQAQGFAPSNFAYPYSKYSPDIKAIVQQCGYTTGRRIGGLSDPLDCLGCPFANTLLPGDPYIIKTPVWQPHVFTLAEMQGWVTQAQDHGGGWVPIVFHDICDACGNSSVSQPDLAAFLDWLKTRPGVSIKTMADVVPAGTPADSTPPQTTVACNGGACGSGFSSAAVSVTLAATDAGSGVSSTRYTTDGSTPTLTSPAYAAPIPVASTTTIKFRSWDYAGNAEATQSQTIKVDTTAPASTIACGGGSCAGWRPPGVSVTLAATDAGSGVSSTRYTTDGSTPTVSSPAYGGAITLAATTTVKFRSYDNAGNAEATRTQLVQVDGAAPASTVACGAAACSSGWYAANVSVTLAATDTGGSGVAAIRYTTDGSTPSATSAAYAAAVSLTSTKTIKYLAFDKAGNAESVKSRLIQIDKAAPTSSITCNSANCATSAYSGSVAVRLSAVDTGGSGLSSIRYTTDGTTPSASSPAYTGPITLTSTKTIKYRAYDAAGNVEGTKTKQVSVA